MQPEQLGPFRIGRVIGRGGMGAVYEGFHEETGALTAVKVLLSTLEEDDELRLRFEAEIDTLKRLRHPNIVRLYGFGEEQGMLYYVMELVDGPSLHQEIKRQRLFQWHEVAKIGLEMCLALKHGHDRGITHRDIKPANILLDQRGTIKLSDYGIAHFFGGQRLTEVNSVVGTLEYMSPEQSLANPVGPRSDLYSLGAVLYMLLVGKPPFAAKNLAEIVRKHQRNIVESIRTVRLDVPDELEAIIFDLLKIKPEERPSNTYLVAKRFQSLMQALVGPPEHILVKPMTLDAPTTLPLEPARIPYRGDDPPKNEIIRPRGMVVENGIIDLGGIVDGEMTDPIQRPPAPGADLSVTQTSPMPSKGTADSSVESLADSFGRPGNDLDDDRQTMGLSTDSAKPTLQESLDLPTEPPESPPDVPDVYEITETSPTQKTKAITTRQGVPGEPNSDATSRTPLRIQNFGQNLGQNLGQGSGIRHGELYLDDATGFRRSKDEPIPDYNSFEGFAPDSESEEPTAMGAPPEDGEIPVYDERNGDATVNGLETDHRPSPLSFGISEQNHSSSEPYGLQSPANVTAPGSRNAGSTVSERATTSHFVSVVDQDFDDFDDDQRRHRPIVSLQTVLASCCLILVGLFVFFLIQPVPPDVRYERIIHSVESGGESYDQRIKSLRRVAKDIDLFLLDHPEYPKNEQLRIYLEQLELDKLQREVERNLQSTDSKMMIPIQRVYMEAMASVKTDPERTIVKLKALIDLFQSDNQPVYDPTEMEGDDPTAKPTRSRFSRGARDEDFVFLATRQVERLERDIDQINAEQVGKLRLRLQYADRLESTQPERSDAIRAAIVELYQNKSWAEEVVREAREKLEH